jgi:hypothetical protein
MDFRRFEDYSPETPAHPPRICWVSKDTWQLWKHYRTDLPQGGADATQNEPPLKVFIDVLFAVRNVYPPQKLHRMRHPEDEVKFLLGQTASAR